MLQNLAIVVDDPVPRCPRPAPAPSSPPNLRTSIPPKRNVDVGQQPQRHPAGRCRSVSVGACWNRRRLARAREGREYDQRRQIPLIFPIRSAQRARESAPLSVLQNLAALTLDPVARCARPAPPPPTRRSRRQHRRRSPEVHRPPPKSANNNSAKKNCRRRPAAAAPPSRPVQVGRRQSALESARPRARA